MNAEWDIKIFTRNFEEYMRMYGKSQKDVADAIGVSAPTVHDWLKGKKMPRMHNVQKLADYFGVKLSDLVEEKVTEEIKEKGDIAADITIRLGIDIEFREVVKRNFNDDEFFQLSKALCKLDSEQVASLRRTLDLLK